MTTENSKGNLVGQITAVVTTIGVILGGWLVIDERYAHAQEVKLYRQQQETQLKQLRIQTTKNFYRSKIDDLEQKKFELNIKPNKTNIDRAYLERYVDQIAKFKKEEEVELVEINKSAK